MVVTTELGKLIQLPNHTLLFTVILECSPGSVMNRLLPATKTTNLFQQSLPLRHKEIHLVNVPSAVRYFYDLISGIMSEKIRSRLRVKYISTSESVFVDGLKVPYLH